MNERKKCTLAIGHTLGSRGEGEDTFLIG
jgi:hypothetical protein